MAKGQIITFQDHENFRLRLILSTLAGKPIKIEKIRSHELNPGLKDYEVSFLRLLEKVTNGSVIEISYTGTTVIYRPGIIIGGVLTHDCPVSKPVGYFIEYMLFLAPFSKEKFSIVFRGITSSKEDVGVDLLKWGFLPVMENFGVRECSIHTLKRGSPPLGGGEVHLLCNSLIAQPITIHALEINKISSIRGIAYCTRVSPSIVNRIVSSVRDVLRNTIGCEVNITTDVWRGETSGKSPGFGLTLFSESKKGKNWRYCIEDIGLARETPEDIGEATSYKFLELLENSGVIGRNQLPLALTYMTIGKEDIGRLKVHKSQIDAKLVTMLRDIKSVFNTQFLFKPSPEEAEEDYLVATVKGVGFTNTSKKVA
ncbi:rRNA-processing endoribonuclease [Komagataella kurtzmanii]|nr:rRNA-processing endoribonuclease [Komagataella kurtzmanii]